jgi:hypothetical protein
LCYTVLVTDVKSSSSTALAYKRRMTTSQILKEAEKRRKLRKEKSNCKRATMMATSVAMTFLVMAATLVTASFLMSPTIEKIFGGNTVYISYMYRGGQASQY